MIQIATKLQHQSGFYASFGLKQNQKLIATQCYVSESGITIKTCSSYMYIAAYVCGYFQKVNTGFRTLENTNIFFYTVENT